MAKCNWNEFRPKPLRLINFLLGQTTKAYRRGCIDPTRLMQTQINLDSNPNKYNNLLLGPSKSYWKDT